MTSAAPGTARTGPAGRPVKPVSEDARERETFRYELYLSAETFKLNVTGRPLPSSELTASGDSVFTALAQLGTYQTGAQRSLISIFDANNQYILAEAMPGMALTPGLSSNDCPSPLALCGTAIPRDHCTCEPVLYSSIEGDDVTKLPVTVARDLCSDPRFASRPFCQLAVLGNFYAAVPIRTQRGINIGVYCVLSSTPMDSWDDECGRRLGDISHAITDHLDANRSRQSHRRNERMNRGLGSFIEGKTTLSGWGTGPNAAAFKDIAKREGALDSTQQRLESQGQEERNRELEHNTDSVPATPGDTAPGLWRGAVAQRPKLAHEAESSADLLRPAPSGDNTDHATPAVEHRSKRQDDPAAEGGTTAKVFSKAANIIREAVEVSGCIFFDVNPTHSASQTQHSTRSRDEDAGGLQPSSTSSSDEQPAISSPDSPDALCELLGFSTSEFSSINSTELPASEGVLPKRFLAKLLRRYPDGHIFSFNAAGEPQSSDGSDEDYNPKGALEPSTTGHGHRSAGGRFGRSNEGALVHETIPSARSVAFVPVWDSRRERWLAGGFVYTLTPARVFTIEGELSFLKAFGKLAATEVHNLETMQANKAKSDALGSLSHELRSPLHGIILGTELLNDSSLSVFQGNVTHTIETCCRTLLDTMDHLLEYSKINSSSMKNKQEGGSKSASWRRRANSNRIGQKKLYANVSLDSLVEDVAETVFAGNSFQHMAVRQLSNQDRQSKHADAAANNRMDSAQAIEQLGPIASNGRGEHKVPFGDVAIYLSVDPSCDWKFRLQAGAVRRIVMNLFGNALKFTTKGAIWISLSQEDVDPPAKSSKTERTVRLAVRDTGKGMSEDYLKNRLFKPFAQENELAAGTGLGLSLVKSIVSQLGGVISVESRVGVGTTVTITLPMEHPVSRTDLAEEDEEYEEQVRNLERLRIRLLGFGPRDGAGTDTDGRAIVEGICRNFLRLDLISEDDAEELTPDLVLWSGDAFPHDFEKASQLSSRPNIVVCPNALVAYQLFTMYQTAGQGGIFEFISQPIGPRKLAKSIQLAYKRWAGLTKLVSPPDRPPGLSRATSSHVADSLSQQTPGTTDARPPGQAASGLFDGRKETREGPADPGIVPPERPAPNADPSPEPKPEGGKEDLDGGKVLLVDDNHINLKVLGAHMGKLRREYVAATNGQEAIDAYVTNAGQFAGILMDLSMPVMDGLEATRAIRAHERKNGLRAVPVVALTGLASDDAQDEAFESGITRFLTKPVRLKDLGEAMAAANIDAPNSSG